MELLRSPERPWFLNLAPGKTYMTASPLIVRLAACLVALTIFSGQIADARGHRSAQRHYQKQHRYKHSARSRARKAAPPQAAMCIPEGADLADILAPSVAKAPADVSIVVQDLKDGTLTTFDPNKDMPAASVDKLPVLIEVFHQIQLGKISLDSKIKLKNCDRDHGWGLIDNARTGKAFTVQQLLSLMIDNSDNTATNMLIRSVGLASINEEMKALGFAGTKLPTDIRTDNHDVIASLRTCASDVAKMYSGMYAGTLIDSSSSEQMLEILANQHENTLIPQLLPAGLKIAHKTGTISDAVIDGGIVYTDSHRYVIVVMTANATNLHAAKNFIRTVSRQVYLYQQSLASRSGAAKSVTPS